MNSPKSNFARSVSILVGGTAGAQLITIAATPLLTRLYTPNDFGVLAVYMSVLALFTVIASLRYELAIPLPKSDEDAIHIVVLCLFITLLMTVLSLTIVLIWGEKGVDILNIPNLAAYLWLLPVGVFFSGIYQTFNYWAIRTKQFPVLARTKIWQKIAAVGIQVCGYKFSTISLIVGQIVGQGAGILSLARTAISNKSFFNWDWKDLGKQAKYYKQYPLYSTWSGFANSAGVYLPPLLFASLFGSASAGLYTLAHSILALPISFIGSAVGNVFLSHAAEAHRNNTLQKLFEDVFSRLVMIAIPLVLVLLIDTPKVFEIVFGSEWREAGVYGQWMTLWLGLVLIGSPLSSIFSVLEKQLHGMIFQVSMTLVRIAVLVMGIVVGDIVLTVALFSMVGVVFWLLFIFWAAKQCNSSVKFVIQCFLKSITLGILLVLPFFIGSQFPDNIYIWWLSACVTSVMILGYYIYQLKYVK
ncbi:lipopolysaccharide biosynthesis protein [Acinetobacter indicus]|uniref:lipopolysaccharide biosynthesis protein n=1 Tax=Acinetobacter indicus TaxID=756892 RepID=UPI000CEBCD3A|nr:oligosaccharide flippase family protein [Acinetobacter indicus]